MDILFSLFPEFEASVSNSTPTQALMGDDQVIEVPEKKMRRMFSLCDAGEVLNLVTLPPV